MPIVISCPPMHHSINDIITYTKHNHGVTTAEEFKTVLQKYAKDTFDNPESKVNVLTLSSQCILFLDPLLNFLKTYKDKLRGIDLSGIMSIDFTNTGLTSFFQAPLSIQQLYSALNEIPSLFALDLNRSYLARTSKKEEQEEREKQLLLFIENNTSLYYLDLDRVFDSDYNPEELVNHVVNHPKLCCVSFDFLMFSKLQCKTLAESKLLYLKITYSCYKSDLTRAFSNFTNDDFTLFKASLALSDFSEDTFTIEKAFDNNAWQNLALGYDRFSKEELPILKKLEKKKINDLMQALTLSKSEVEQVLTCIIREISQALSLLVSALDNLLPNERFALLKPKKWKNLYIYIKNFFSTIEVAGFIGQFF